MTGHLNKVQIIGNLGKDPDLRYTPNSTPVCKLVIATTEKVKQGDIWVDETEWYNIVLWNRKAEIAGDYLRKGNQVYIEGKKKTRKWQDENGKDCYFVEIIASDMQILGGKGHDTPDAFPANHQEPPSGAING